MAFTIKDYKIKGVKLPEAYVKILDITATKYGGFHGTFGIYASKESADENIGNILMHISASCPYEAGVNPWEVLYEYMKESPLLKDYVLTDA